MKQSDKTGTIFLRQLTAFFLCITLAVSFVLSAETFAGNGDTDEIKEKKGELQEAQQEKKNKEQELTEGKQELKELTEEIRDLEKQIYAVEVEINDKQQEINDTKELILEKMDDLRVREEEIATQNEDLNERLRSMYKNGETGMLAILFGSSSMSEYMTNMDMVQRIYESDAKLLADMEAAYGVVLDARNELQYLKKQLQNEEAAIQEKKDGLEEDKAALAKKKSQVDSSNKLLESEIDRLNSEAKALSAEILKLQSAASYVGGAMLWPAQSSKYVSSNFGNRLHPILKVYKFHTGIDIAAAMGTNILAANDGEVISACYNSGYGYMVMIDHGGGIVTLYAHSSKLLVSKGTKVKRGQVIALVGSTGSSTGPHLHFEVRINGEYKNPLEYVTR